MQRARTINREILATFIPLQFKNPDNCLSQQQEHKPHTHTLFGYLSSQKSCNCDFLLRHQVNLVLHQ